MEQLLLTSVWPKVNKQHRLSGLRGNGFNDRLHSIVCSNGSHELPFLQTPGTVISTERRRPLSPGPASDTFVFVWLWNVLSSANLSVQILLTVFWLRYKPLTKHRTNESLRVWLILTWAIGYRSRGVVCILQTSRDRHSHVTPHYVLTSTHPTVVLHFLKVFGTISCILLWQPDTKIIIFWWLMIY